MTDVIVTGLPRSGATVVAALVDYQPNTACINSPPEHIAYARRQTDAMLYCKWLVGDFAWQRAQLLRNEPIPDFRAADGAPLMDGLYDPKQPRDESGAAIPLFFARPTLKKGFTLAMKHHVLYTALLPILAQLEHFKIIAVIRHPLDVISSWQKMGKPPLGRGNPPGIMRFWPEALALAESALDETDRLVQLYELHMQRYYELREQIHILKYEDVVQDPMIVSRLAGTNQLPANAPKIQPRRRTYNAKLTTPIRESLRKYGVFAKEYYGL